MTDPGFARETFTTPPERIQRITALVLRHVRPEEKARVLDLGCGTGEQLFALAEALPAAQLTGLDVSEPSIRLAQERRRRSRHADRLAFHLGDYIGFPEGGFDLILADTVLHAIEAPDARLFRKLSEDLAPGGRLIYTMPRRSAYNSALAVVRRCFRPIRTPLTDGLVMAAARLLHGRHYSEAELRERLLYMYLVPERYDSPALHRTLRDGFGLELLESGAIPHASVAQMKHTYAVLRRGQVLNSDIR